MTARRQLHKNCPMCFGFYHVLKFRGKDVCWMCYIKPEYEAWSSKFRAKPSHKFMSKMATISNVDYGPKSLNFDRIDKDLVGGSGNEGDSGLHLSKPFTIPPLRSRSFEQEVFFKGSRPFVKDDVPSEDKALLAAITLDVRFTGDADNLHSDGGEDIT